MRKAAAWDPSKARANFLKHGVRFSDAVGVLFDSMAITKEDTRAVGEQRFVRVGTDYGGRVVVVVHTIEEPVPRIISARRATRRERRQYEEGI